MTTHKHPDPNHDPETHEDDAPETATVKGNKVTTTTTTTIEVADAKPKPKPANESGGTTTATEEPKKKGMSPWAIAGAVALGLLLLGLLGGGMYWFGSHNGTPAMPVATAGTCCPQVAIAGFAPSTCCPQPPAPTPPPPPPAKSAQQCANEAVSGMQVANADDQEAAADAALEACKEAGLK